VVHCAVAQLGAVVVWETGMVETLSYSSWIPMARKQKF
jgi:hypothetical protein